MLMQTEIGLLLGRTRLLDLKTIWLKVFTDVAFKEKILNWIRQDQLFKQGIDEDGDIIGTYSEFTEMINPSKVAGTPYTLFDTGEFYRSMIIYVFQKEIVIDADPIKTDESGKTTNLFNEYGEGIIGLTDENKTKLANELVERFNKEARKLLQID
jgi:hypothetical protein